MQPLKFLCKIDQGVQWDRCQDHEKSGRARDAMPYLRLYQFKYGCCSFTESQSKLNTG